MMKKFFLASLALATALAITPAAVADTFTYSFTSDGVLASGTLTGTPAGGGAFDLTSGNVSITGGPDAGTGTLFGGSGSQMTSPSGYFYYDNVVYTSNPYIDNNGLLFLVNGSLLELNIFSNGGAPDSWQFYDNTGFNVYGNFTLTDISATPEPSSLLLLGTGLLGLAFVAFRKAKSSGLVLHS
jgi:hypothetical protein